MYNLNNIFVHYVAFLILEVSIDHVKSKYVNNKLFLNDGICCQSE